MYKFSPRDQDHFLNIIKSHRNYKTIFKAKGYPGEDGVLVYKDPKALIRKCKAGLLWITEGNSDRHIHFLLDGIDSGAVANKSYDRDRKVISITGSELRWIYRKRYNQNVMKKIQFWDKGIPASPPWISSPFLWQRYNRVQGLNVKHPLSP